MLRYMQLRWWNQTGDFVTLQGPLFGYTGCASQCWPYSISQEICTRFVVLCFVVVLQSFIMNPHEVFIHIHQGCFAGTGAIVRLSQCQWSKPDGYGKISQCITTTKHSKAKTVSIFLGIYCMGVICFHDDVIKWKHFPRYWPFVQGIHRSPVNSPYKGQWGGALMFPWFPPE